MHLVYDSVVIGAGQAGLSASYHLGRRGLRHVVLDADAAPGGAWQHRWDSLTMADVHGIAALPDADRPEAGPAERANDALPTYFADYESTHGLPVERPVRVDRVSEGTGDEAGLLIVRAGVRRWVTRTLVNATGTWSQPFIPHYPGIATFRGEQLHTHDYPGPEHFRGRRTLVVGGGASAVQLLGEIAPVTETLWVTRRPPGLAHRRLHARGRPGRGGAGRRTSPARVAARERRERHGTGAARAGAPRRVPGRLPPPSDVR